MDIGVVVALSGFGLASLLVVLIGIVSAVSAPWFSRLSCMRRLLPQAMH